MAKKLDEGTQITLDLKTIGIILFFVATVVGMWFTLQADIEEAKALPSTTTTRCYSYGIRYEGSINSSNYYDYERRCRRNKN